jgi:hypothetical protein
MLPERKVIVGNLASLPASYLFDSILYIDVLEQTEEGRAEPRRTSEHLKSSGLLISSRQPTRGSIVLSIRPSGLPGATCELHYGMWSC